jgi:hypothetical protein
MMMMIIIIIIIIVSSSSSSSSSDNGLLLGYSKMFQLHRLHSEKWHGETVSKNLVCRQPEPISGY